MSAPDQTVRPAPGATLDEKTGRGETRRSRLTEAEFWGLVSPCPVTGCWWWLGPTTARGYGTASVNGKCGPAHRHALRLATGQDIDAKREFSGRRHPVCHRCHNGHLGCVNPAHLYVGTVLSNVHDTFNGPRSIRGGRHYKAHMTDHDVLVMRRMVRIFKTTAARVARVHAARFDMAQASLQQAITGMSWHHIPGACYSHDRPWGYMDR